MFCRNAKEITPRIGRVQVPVPQDPLGAAAFGDGQRFGRCVVQPDGANFLVAFVSNLGDFFFKILFAVHDGRLS